jgi:hypothetical protein
MITERDSAEFTSPSISRDLLGREIRRLREAALLRLEDVAARLEVAPSTVSRIETGVAPARTSYVDAILDMCGADDPGYRRELVEMARLGRRKGWWTRYSDVLSAATGAYLGFECAASAVRSFSPLVLPELVQTGEYAHALRGLAHPPSGAAHAARLGAVTARRQEQARSNQAQRVHLVICESALRRVIGSPPVMARQLGCLAGLAADRSVTVQVALIGQAHPVLAVPFTVLSFTQPEVPDLGCLGDVHGGCTVVKRDSEVAALAARFAALCRSALPAGESAQLIRRLAEQADHSSGHSGGVRR